MVRAFAFWVFKYYGFKDVRLMNGARKKWFEEDRPVSLDVPSHPRGDFKASEPDNSIRVYSYLMSKRFLAQRTRYWLMLEVLKNTVEKYWFSQCMLQNNHPGEGIYLEPLIFRGTGQLMKMVLSSLLRNLGTSTTQWM